MSLLDSPADSETYSINPANDATNLTVMSSEAQPDVNDRIQETAFNDAAIVSNEESTTPFSGIERFQELTSIINFLKRPTLLWQSKILASNQPLNPLIAFTGNQVEQIPLKTFEFPRDLMVVGNKMDKIRNFEWFKTDVRLRILINANPFIAGRLWITYSPIDSSNNTDTLVQYAQIHRKGRVGITSYPGVELDLQTNTAAELLVPWIATTDAERANPEDQRLFRVDIWLLTPLLLADNSKSIPIQVFGSFENVDLKFPTPTAYSNAAVRQVKGEAKGPITEVSSKIGSAAKMLKDVPIVGTVASTVGWAADIASGVASIFGWTRPIEGSHSEPFVHIPGRGMSQFKSKDSGTVLGMANDNEIAEQTNNFVSDVDEMSIEHICSRPGLVDVIDWSTIQDYNEGLGVYSAERDPQPPNWKAVTTSRGAGAAWDPTLAELVLNSFHMYRADFSYRISLVKTAFHVGRFEVFFIPNVKTVAADTIRNLDTSNCYRQIFDITEQSEMSFTIPFFHKYTMFQGPDDSVDPSIGCLVIRVVSPLTCPDTVSQNIKILVWKSASNIAVAHPDLQNYMPFNDVTFPSNKAVRQINVTNEPRDTEYVVFDQTNTQQDAIKAATSVAGEICMNLRQATRAFRPHMDLPRVYQSGPLILPNIPDYRMNGYLGLCSMIYYFYRGGLSYKILDLDGTGLKTSVQVTRHGDAFESDSNAPFHFTPSNNPIHEVSVPFYSQKRRNVSSRKETAAGDLGSVDPAAPHVVLRKFDGSVPDSARVPFYTAAKDDFTFGFMVGSPTIFRNYGLSA